MCIGDADEEGAKLPTHMEYDKRETKYAKKYVKQPINKLKSRPKLNFLVNKLQSENNVTRTNNT